MVFRCSFPLFLLLGCGPAVAESPSTSEASGADSSSGGTSSAQTGPSTASTQGPTTQGSTTGALCDVYDDDLRPAAEDALVEIHNESSGTILLEANCGIDYLRIETDDGWSWPGPFCTETCQEQLVSGCSVCDGCGESLYLPIPAGSRAEAFWPRVVFEEATPPSTCVGEFPLCGDSTCPILRDALEFGEVQLRVSAVLQPDCEAVAEDPSACLCAPPTDCESFIPTTQPPVFTVFEGVADPATTESIVVTVTD